MFAAIGAVHCGNYTTTTTVRLADPHLVSVYRASPDNAEPLLPAGAGAARALIPGADAEVLRDADGALTLEYDRPFGVSCVPLNGLGMLTLRSSVCVGRVVPDVTVFRAHYVYFTRRQRSLSVTMTSPWSNVLEIRERQSLDRVAGWIWLVLGSVAVAAGSKLAVATLDDPVATHRAVPVPEIVAPTMILGGGLMLAAGVFHAFFPTRERIVFSRF